MVVSFHTEVEPSLKNTTYTCDTQLESDSIILKSMQQNASPNRAMYFPSKEHFMQHITFRSKVVL